MADTPTIDHGDTLPLPRTSLVGRDLEIAVAPDMDSIDLTPLAVPILMPATVATDEA